VSDAGKNYVDYIYNLVKVAQAMRTNNVVNVAGTVDDDIYYSYDPKTNNNFQTVRDVNGYKSSFMMRCRNGLDLLGLNWLYMPPTVWEKNASKKTVQWAIEIKKEYEKTAQEVIPQTYVEYKNNNLTINDVFNQLDTQEPDKMCALVSKKVYDFLTSNEVKKQWCKGTRTGKFKGEGELETAFFKQQTEKMFTQVYGVHLDIPSETFTLGNHKLGDDTLIINFASAHQCPA
jgi:hypothetical protein